MPIYQVGKHCFPEKSALWYLVQDWRLWVRFRTELARSPLFLGGLEAIIAGRGDLVYVASLSAFELVEPEAQAWVLYFKQCGLWCFVEKTNGELALCK